MTFTLDKHSRIELTAAAHAEGLFNAIDSNRAHLSAFLPWVDAMRSIDDLRSYIRTCETLHAQNKELSFVIFSDDIIVGRIGLHHINEQNRSGAIGYWLAEDHLGKGLVTRSCEAIITFAFEQLHLHRIEIKAAVANFKSQAIPERLNFKKEGILRQAELVNEKFIDLYIYSLLHFEWEGQRQA